MKPPLVRLRKGHVLIALVSLAILIAGACGKDVTVPRGDHSAASTVAAAPAVAPRAIAAKSEMSRDATQSALPPSADQVANSNSAAVVAPSMVIRNGTASIEVDSLELAIAAVNQLAVSLGGYVGNTSLTAGALSVRSAVMELKIPSTRYDAAVGGLAPIGKVESQTSTAEDVGEEFVDVQARQANARKLEERLITLLATRTGKLEDVLAVERELARVREEIERYEGRLRYLKSHVATSTLAITVHEKRPIVGEYAGENIIANSFKRAWRIFMQFIAGLISSLGWIIPLAVMGAILYPLVKRWNAYAAKQTAPPPRGPDNRNSSDGTNQ